MEEEIKKDKSKMKGSKIAGLTVAGVLILLVLVICIFGIGIYGFNWKSGVARKSMDIFPYPVSLVNHKFLRYSDFYNDVDTLTHYYKKMSEAGNGKVEMPDTSDLEIIALKRLIKNEFTRQLAKDYKVDVSKIEVGEELEKIISQSEGKEAVEEILKDLYNWSTEDLKENVLYHHLIRAKLQEKLSYDDELEKNKEAKKKAEDVLAKLKKGEDTFENLAKKYSEDGTASQGGKLGYFGLGEMVSEFEEAAKKLKVDEFSDIIRTKYGFHIIKLLGKKGKGINTQFEASHILIKTQDIDDYINDKLKEARVYVFAKGIKWDKESGEAVMPGFEETQSGL